MIAFLDLAAEFTAVAEDARARLDGVLARQQFVLGPETAELERSLQRRLGVASAVAVSSGTEALAISLLALGVGPGDAVLVPAFTFFATAGAVVRAGARPVFCDVAPGTLLAGPREFEAAIEREFRRDGGAWRHRASGARLSALLPVHLYGRACDMDGIVRLGGEAGASVVEDAAQAIGCRIGDAAVGSFGATGCFSFYPTKNLGGAGDGGLVVTNDAGLGARLARLRSHGSEHGSYLHDEVGVNARMSEMEAAVLNAKLSCLDAWNARRRDVAARYSAALAEAARRGLLELPPAAPAGSHVWHQYAVGLPAARRDRVRRRLEDAGIATRVFYPLPLHRQPCFAGLATPDLPESEAASRAVLCLPIRPSLADADVDRVAAALVAAAGE